MIDDLRTVQISRGVVTGAAVIVEHSNHDFFRIPANNVEQAASGRATVTRLVRLADDDIGG